MRRLWLRLLVIGLLGLAGVVLLYKLRSLFIPFGLAVLIAYLVYPLVNSLEERRVGRLPAILTVYAAGMVLACIFFVLFIPALLKETRGFGNILATMGDSLDFFRGKMHHLLLQGSLPPEVQQILYETSRHLEGAVIQSLRKFTRELTDALLRLISLLPSLVLAPFLAYYLIKDFDYLKKHFLAILPPGSRSSMVYLLREADGIFSSFLRGHLTVSLIVGFLTGAGAALIGLPFFLLIGIFTAIADLIPIFGPLIAAFPVIGLALAESRLKGILMLAVFLVVQQLEGSVLVPRLLGDRVGLHPLAVVLVLLVAGYLFGPLGLIFGVPLAALLRVVFRFVWERMV